MLHRTMYKNQDNALGFMSKLCKFAATIAVMALCFVVAPMFIACSDAVQSGAYTVTFDSCGGSEVSSASYNEGDTVNRPSAPVKDMFVFNDWYTDRTFKTKFTFGSKMPAHDMTLYAGWLPSGSVTVTFDANGGEYEGGATLYEEIGGIGEAFSAPGTTPVFTGYVFDSWYTDRDCTEEYSFETYPADNMTLYAGWDKDSEYAYFSYYGNGRLIEVVPVRKGADVEKYSIDDDAVIMDEWYTDEELTAEYTFGKAETDISLYTAYYTEGLVMDGGAVTGYTGDSTVVYVPSYNAGSKITEIAPYAFYRSGEVSQIVRVVLPDTVTTVGEGAFYWCSYLVDAGLTASVTEIGDNAFFYNERLKTPGDISSVESIGSHAFIGCKSLVSIELPKTLVSLGTYAFADCFSLLSITVPVNVTAIGEYTFSGCKALREATFLSGALETMDKDVFEKCTALKSVVIQSSLRVEFVAVSKTYKDSPFRDCPEVKIAVRQSLLESYVNDYGYLDSETLGDKFVAIGK